jgi:succinate dehydrogenase/fumarate reductase flavoprotein subunit
MSKVRQKSTRSLVTNEVSLPPPRRLEKTDFETDILVVGSGYAGVFAALKAAEKGQRVILVDKGIVGKSGQSPWAQGLSFFDASLGDDYDDWLWGAQKRSEFVGNMDYVKMWLDDSKSIYN